VSDAEQDELARCNSVARRACHLRRVTLIELFEVPPERDADFLADWRRERDEATLYRAVREDVAVRFVSVGPGGSYALAHEDGDVDGAGGVIVVAPIVAADDAFVAGWQRLRELLAARRGYLGTRLYRSASDYPCVVVTRWSSPLMVFRATRDPDIRAAADAIGFPPAPALYQRVAP
jgi:hypothetical protein